MICVMGVRVRSRYRMLRSSKLNQSDPQSSRINPVSTFVIAFCRFVFVGSQISSITFEAILVWRFWRFCSVTNYRWADTPDTHTRSAYAFNFYPKNGNYHSNQLYSRWLSNYTYHHTSSFVNSDHEPQQERYMYDNLLWGNTDKILL